MECAVWAGNAHHLLVQLCLVRSSSGCAEAHGSAADADSLRCSVCGWLLACIICVGSQAHTCRQRCMRHFGRCNCCWQPARGPLFAASPRLLCSCPLSEGVAACCMAACTPWGCFGVSVWWAGQSRRSRCPFSHSNGFPLFLPQLSVKQCGGSAVAGFDPRGGQKGFARRRLHAACHLVAVSQNWVSL